MSLTRDEFERLALEQIDMIDRLARTLARNVAEAEDLVQETYLRAIRAWPNFELRDHGIRPWLIRILRNAHITRIGKAARQPSLATDEALEAALPKSEPGESDLERWEVYEELKQSLAALAPDMRSILELWAVETMTYQEIADAFEIPIGTVMSRLHRAKGLLREEYECRQRITPRTASYIPERKSN